MTEQPPGDLLALIHTTLSNLILLIEAAGGAQAGASEPTAPPAPPLLTNESGGTISAADLQRIAYLAQDAEQVIRDLTQRAQSARVLCDELSRQNEIARELARK